MHFEPVDIDLANPVFIVEEVDRDEAGKPLVHGASKNNWR